MTTLDFKGPHHFSEIENLPDIKKKGIYIWGFMYERRGNLLGEAIKFKSEQSPKGQELKYLSDKMQFIPYYVGKSETSVYDRIIKHQDVRNSQGKSSDAAKYIRFSQEYMKEFFRDNDFPLKIWTAARVNEFLKLNKKDPGAITYHNNIKILEKIQGGKIKIKTINGNQPITDQKLNGADLPDTLFDLVNPKTNNNFWFCYAVNPGKNTELVDLETAVFYSLKGRTTSMTKRLKGQQVTILNNSALNIFETKPSEDFDGYLPKIKSTY